jgi:hypothetical protein
MRTAMTWILALFFVAGAALAEDAPPPDAGGEGEEKPKTEEEKRWDKIVENLTRLKTAEEQDLGFEAEEKEYEEVEEELFKIGKEALDQLETLLPKPDEKGFPRYSDTLREIMGRQNEEAVLLIMRVMKRHGWVPPEWKEKLARLKEELHEKDSEPNDLFSQFAELDWFGIKGLRDEFDQAKGDKLEAKILETLILASAQVPLLVSPHLIDLAFHEDIEVKRKALSGLADMAGGVRGADFKNLDKLFMAERAYSNLVGFLRLDKDTDVRMFAARVLGNMELEAASQELVNALDDPKERVQGEAAVALFYIARGVKQPENPNDWNRALKAWWKMNKSKAGKQIKAAKPVRYKKPDDK